MALFKINDQHFLKTLSNLPGVYQMLDQQGKILYIGKAKNLKNRLDSYFRKNIDNIKTKALMKRVTFIKTIITHTENEALILENQLIKKYQPRYNISFRDDKTYPYIFLSDENFPRLTLHRGYKKEKGAYFGPYTRVKHAHDHIHMLQKLFHLRTCPNTAFRSRNRPCLQYQIHRCSGPCVNMISRDSYLQDTHLAKMFLAGYHKMVMNTLINHMNQTAQKLQYELASKYRDQIKVLKEMQTQQDISSDQGNFDVLALSSKSALTCIQLLTIRHGKITGYKTFLPQTENQINLSQMMSALITQYYLNTGQFVPKEIICNCSPDHPRLLQNALQIQTGYKTVFKTRVKKTRAKLLSMALLNAEQIIKHQLSLQSDISQKLFDLQKALHLSHLPKKIVCFDISHHSGEATVASCIVFGKNGPVKKNYRRFNIENTKACNDLSAMKQALQRYCTRIKNKKYTSPDLLIVDGGKGQIKQADTILKSFKLTDIVLLGIAKSINRKQGLEKIYTVTQKQPMPITPDSKAFHLLQQIRDEAHRFAVTLNRKKLIRNRKTSILENIDGIGLKRKQLLLKHFNGLQDLKKATLKDLITIDGIHETLAKRIYEYLQAK
jgi:excinuclease ABC subunit C